MSSRGRFASAAQSAMRCCSPPDSSRGSASARSRSLTRSSSSRARDSRLLRRHRRESERQRDELVRRELALERSPVVLVGVAEDVAPIGAELARRCVRNVGSGDDQRAGGWAGQAGEHAHERRLPGSARAEHDADLPLLHREREPLQRGHASGLRGVDGEELACVDERGHQSVSRYAGPRSPGEGVTRGSSDQQGGDDPERRDAAREQEGIDDDGERRLRVASASRDGHDAGDEQEQREAGQRFHRPPRPRRRSPLVLGPRAGGTPASRPAPRGRNARRCRRAARSARRA